MVKKTFGGLALFFAFVMIGSPASAGNGNGLPNNITVQANFLLFSATGTHTGNPACSTTSRWALTLTTPGGQAIAAQLLTAYSLGKAVTILGDGTCGVYPDSESITYVNLP